ncbi:MAG: class I SAM-dependent methyltransferase [Alphaproteobacteria bacterium]|nr:MAG: class I SAM-dependent methyltransferase [Alphaproteobacteria bacterium]
MSDPVCTFSALEQIIRERIKARGAITVAEYMDMALGHEQYGYYMNRDPFGEHGDFTTAPEICQIFGELIGAWCAAVWQSLGSRPMMLMELGGGRGTLMTDLLRATRHVHGFHEALTIVMVDASPFLRRFQRAVLHGMHPRIRWQANIEALPDLPLLCIANEFFDALPIRQYAKTLTGLRERLVAIDPHTNELTFVMHDMGIKLVKGGGHSTETVHDSQIIESCPAMRHIATHLAHHMQRHGGAGLFIDYGYRGESRGNTLQAIKTHGFWPVLKSPGDADITAHVAFDDLAHTFEEAGLASTSITTQGAFLQSIGGVMRLGHLLAETHKEEQKKQLRTGFERLVSPQYMGELFKVLGVCSNGQFHLPGFADS